MIWAYSKLGVSTQPASSTAVIIRRHAAVTKPRGRSGLLLACNPVAISIQAAAITRVASANGRHPRSTCSRAVRERSGRAHGTRRWWRRRPAAAVAMIIAGAAVVVAP